jgi:ribosomal protein L7Ae-like RNA K-turn-binding protein
MLVKETFPLRACWALKLERKKTQLMVTAIDVDPIKLVVFPPALCCIIQGKKARLEQLVHRERYHLCLHTG